MLERTTWSSSPPPPRYHANPDPPCATLLVDGMVRGGYLGFLWGMVSSTAPSLSMFESAKSPVMLMSRPRAIGTSSGVFAMLLGSLSGATCLASTFTRRSVDHPVNAMLGGLFTGVVFSLPTMRPNVIASSGLQLACFNAAVYLAIRQ